MVHQVTSNVSPFSECLELFPDFKHISVAPSNIIPLVVFDVRPPRKPIYLFVLSLEVLPSEFVALHLPEMHDETYKHKIICNDYKFVAYPHSILQTFTIKNVVMTTIHSERFFLGTESRCTLNAHVLLES